MGANSRIEWTDHTWNPWYGCQKVSQGCKNCYMYREMKQYGKDPATVQRSKTMFQRPLAWAKKYPGSRIFTCSWSDFFIRQADEWREEAWEVIRRTPELHYLILTKRPELAIERLPADWGLGWKHVWIGTSIEDQAAARLRLKQLLAIPAAHRFLSLEPLLGPVDLPGSIPTPTTDDVWEHVNLMDDDYPPEELIEECEAECDWINYGNDLVLNPEYREWVSWREQRARQLKLWLGIDWVIVGGETGPGARPCHPDWVRGVREFCRGGEIPFFFKGWGDNLPVEGEADGSVPWNGRPVEFRAVGKKQAGRLLDGREWLDVPDELALSEGQTRKDVQS